MGVFNFVMALSSLFQSDFDFFLNGRMPGSVICGTRFAKWRLSLSAPLDLRLWLRGFLVTVDHRIKKIFTKMAATVLSCPQTRRSRQQSATHSKQLISAATLLLSKVYHFMMSSLCV